jgi:hypothetical protein
MTCASRLPVLLLPFLLLASGVNASPPAPTHNPPKPVRISSAERSPNQAMLLVSLEDGTVIKQTINVDADVCFKQNTSSSTLCFTQGDAIMDATTNTVIGFEMIEERIDLVAKTS